MGLVFKSATETTANLDYSVSFSIREDAYGLSYTGSIGGTRVNSYRGNVTVYELTPGEANNIIGSITCSYYYDVTTSNADGSYSTTTYSDSKTISIGLIVYTHPGAWHWADYIAQNDIIEQKLTYTLVNQWVDHLSKWKSWDTQSDWYNSYNDYYNANTGTGYKVHSKDIIYMQWFNNCATAHPTASTISHNNNEDIISLDRFSTLDFNGAQT